MQAIEKRRKRLGLSLRRAGALASMSEARWRQLENGFRLERGIHVPQPATDHMLAHMARAVGFTAGELRDAGYPDAAVILEDLNADEAGRSAAELQDAAVAAAAIGHLSQRDRDRVTAWFAEDLRRLRDE